MWQISEHAAESCSSAVARAGNRHIFSFSSYATFRDNAKTKEFDN